MHGINRAQKNLLYIFLFAPQNNKQIVPLSQNKKHIKPGKSSTANLSLSSGARLQTRARDKVIFYPFSEGFEVRISWTTNIWRTF